MYGLRPSWERNQWTSSNGRSFLDILATFVRYWTTDLNRAEMSTTSNAQSSPELDVGTPTYTIPLEPTEEGAEPSNWKEYLKSNLDSLGKDRQPRVLYRTKPASLTKITFHSDKNYTIESLDGKPEEAQQALSSARSVTVMGKCPSYSIRGRANMLVPPCTVLLSAPPSEIGGRYHIGVLSLESLESSRTSDGYSNLALHHVSTLPGIPGQVSMTQQYVASRRGYPMLWGSQPSAEAPDSQAYIADSWDLLKSYPTSSVVIPPPPESLVRPNSRGSGGEGGQDELADVYASPETLNEEGIVWVDQADMTAEDGSGHGGGFLGYE